MNPSLNLTPAQLDQLVELMQLHGSSKPFEEMLMQVGVPPAEIPSRIQEAINLFRIRATQFNDPRYIEMLEALAHRYPQALQQLANIARVGGTFAEDSFDALRSVASYRPSDVVPYLQWLAERGSGFANQAVQLLGELAKNGNQAARNALTEISRNPGLYGSALATAARALLAAMTAISTTALIIGASILVAAGLIGGYIWSRGDKPVEPGPAMSRPASERSGLPSPNPPATGAMTGFPDVSGRWYSGYDIVRDYTQSGNKITWSVDYPWGGGTRHEDSEGTVSDLSSGSARIEANITYTEANGLTYKANYTGTVSVDSDGKATRIVWSNNDVLTRVP